MVRRSLVGGRRSLFLYGRWALRPLWQTESRVLRRVHDGNALLTALRGLTIPVACAALVPPEVRTERLAAEKQLVGLVLARWEAPLAPADAGVTPDQGAALESEVKAFLGPYPGRFDRLPDGSLLAQVGQAEATATDQAVQAVQVALLLAERLRGWSVAVTLCHLQLHERHWSAEELGRTVALAHDRARVSLSTATEPLWLDELTARLVDTRYHVRRIAGGWTVEGRRSGDEELRTVLGQATPCVGREQELQLLETSLDSCIEDSAARVMLVLAPPGTGKSRLVATRQYWSERRKRAEASEIRFVVQRVRNPPDQGRARPVGSEPCDGPW